MARADLAGRGRGGRRERRRAPAALEHRAARPDARVPRACSRARPRSARTSTCRCSPVATRSSRRWAGATRAARVRRADRGGPRGAARAGGHHRRDVRLPRRDRRRRRGDAAFCESRRLRDAARVPLQRAARDAALRPCPARSPPTRDGRARRELRALRRAPARRARRAPRWAPLPTCSSRRSEPTGSAAGTTEDYLRVSVPGAASQLGRARVSVRLTARRGRGA